MEYSKAFDNVPLGGLVWKTRSHKIPYELANWFQIIGWMEVIRGL